MTDLSPALRDEPFTIDDDDGLGAELGLMFGITPETRAAYARMKELEELAFAAGAMNPAPQKPHFPTKKARRQHWFRERRKRDPIFALNNNTRNAVYKSLRGLKRGRKWQELVGYTIDELRVHLEAQFVDGMGWHNIGDWHVDHIRPLSSFRITGPDCPEFRAAWALSNLQPLWAKDNLRKSWKWSEAA